MSHRDYPDNLSQTTGRCTRYVLAHLQEAEKAQEEAGNSKQKKEYSEHAQLLLSLAAAVDALIEQRPFIDVMEYRGYILDITVSDSTKSINITPLGRKGHGPVFM